MFDLLQHVSALQNLICMHVDVHVPSGSEHVNHLATATHR